MSLNCSENDQVHSTDTSDEVSHVIMVSDDDGDDDSSTTTTRVEEGLVKIMKKQRHALDLNMELLAQEQSKKPTLEVMVRREFYDSLQELRSISTVVRKLDHLLENTLYRVEQEGGVSMQDLQEDVETYGLTGVLKLRYKMLNLYTRLSVQERLLHQIHRRVEVHSRRSPRTLSLEQLQLWATQKVVRSQRERNTRALPPLSLPVLLPSCSEIHQAVLDAEVLHSTTQSGVIKTSQ